MTEIERKILKIKFMISVECAKRRWKNFVIKDLFKYESLQKKKKQKEEQEKKNWIYE